MYTLPHYLLIGVKSIFNVMYGHLLPLRSIAVLPHKVHTAQLQLAYMHRRHALPRHANSRC
jgi:hypothetical protein